MKLGHMDNSRFENVIAEFAPKFENLKQLEFVCILLINKHIASS
jgi:hypothetical protein